MPPHDSNSTMHTLVFITCVIALSAGLFAWFAIDIPKEFAYVVPAVALNEFRGHTLPDGRPDRQIIGDYTVPVAERILNDILYYIRKNGGETQMAKIPSVMRISMRKVLV